jgi:cell division protease FtsH
MAQRIDQEIIQILDAAYQRARTLLSQHKDRLETLARTLLDIETVERPQFEALMAA